MSLRDERGLTLIELLVSIIVTTIVVGATLTMFIAMTRQNTRENQAVDAESQARISLDRLERELRNMASPGADLTSVSSTLPYSIDRDLPYDLVFQSVRDQPVGPSTDANVQRIRYCLTSSTTGADVYRMDQQVAGTTYPTDTSCPGTGWADVSKVASNVVNRINGQSRPLFGYASETGDVTGTDATSRSTITRVRTFLYVDTTPNTGPAETAVQSSVYLRNQNRAPTASFTVTVLNNSTRAIQLNGSQSDDPEDQQLTYKWFEDGNQIGTGIVLNYTSPTRGTHTYQLKVFDPANLEGDSPTQTVTFT